MKRVLAAVLAVLTTVALLPAAAASDAPALQWTACEGTGMDGLECTFITVPRDWSHPADGTMRVAMARHRSEGTADERIGSLFFNPGGPGGSGLGALAYTWGILPPEARRRFDLVTWDPRGVGASEGLLDCQPAQVSLPPAVGPVDWTALQTRTRAAIARVNAACQAKHPLTVAHMGTNANVEDLDAMRAAVGDAKLTYWAWSYGTRIGYVYALKHPDHVRAIVLDGSTSPNGSRLGFAGPYSTAADAGLNIFFQLHPGTADDYRIARSALAQAPITLPDNRVYTQWDLDLFLQDWAGWESMYPLMATYLHNVRLATTASGQVQADAATVVSHVVPSTPEAMSAAAGIVQCSDYADTPPFSREVAVATAARLAAPITGWFRGLSTTMPCAGLRLAPDPVPTFVPTDWTSRLLLLAATLDTQTPYQWTAAMSSTFRASRVVTYVGAKHVVFGSGSTCVDDLALDYFINGTLPAVNPACPNSGTLG